jgi:hypothetical protein
MPLQPGFRYRQETVTFVNKDFAHFPCCANRLQSRANLKFGGG